MFKSIVKLFFITGVLAFVACSTAYKATPTSFKMPDSFNNVTNVSGAKVAARAFNDAGEAKKTFGFDIRGAGMLPVQVVFNNEGNHILKVNASQTFIEDTKGNLWPILSSKIANERATKYAVENKMIKDGAKHAFWGAAIGSVVGAAIGIVTGENVGSAVGKGAAVGAAGGAVIGSTKAYATDDSKEKVMDDFREKSLKNREIGPKTIAYGFLFFPGEAVSARQLRLQLIEEDTGNVSVVELGL